MFLLSDVVAQTCNPSPPDSDAGYTKYVEVKLGYPAEIFVVYVFAKHRIFCRDATWSKNALKSVDRIERMLSRLILREAKATKLR